MMRNTAILCALACLAACGPVQDTRPGQPVAHRQAAFKEILKTFEPLGVLLREDRFDAEAARTMADALVARRAAPWEYFAAGTDYPPSHAKPGVWQAADKFAAAKEDFFKASDALVLAAKSGDKHQVAQAYAAVSDSCKRCHQDFKER